MGVHCLPFHLHLLNIKPNSFILGQTRSMFMCPVFFLDFFQRQVTCSLTVSGMSRYRRLKGVPQQWESVLITRD